MWANKADPGTTIYSCLRARARFIRHFISSSTRPSFYRWWRRRGDSRPWAHQARVAALKCSSLLFCVRAKWIGRSVQLTLNKNRREPRTAARFTAHPLPRLPSNLLFINLSNFVFFSVFLNSELLSDALSRLRFATWASRVKQRSTLH